jgi:AraC family transcriptional regulator
MSLQGSSPLLHTIPTYASYAAFYQDVYRPYLVAHRPAGNLGSHLLMAAECGGDWSGRGTADLIITLDTEIDCRAQIDAGAGKFEQHLKTGDILITPPFVDTSIVVEKSHRVMCLGIPYAKTREWVESNHCLPSDGDFGALHRKMFRDDEIKHIMLRLWMESESGNPHGALYADAAILMLLSRLVTISHPAKTSRFRGGLAPWQLKRTIDCLRDFGARHLSLESLARSVGLSPFHFSRAFKISTGLPPYRYQMRLKIEKAQEMMRTPLLSLSDISTSCGFSSQAHFTTAFVKHTGMSPAAWRKKLR